MNFLYTREESKANIEEDIKQLVWLKKLEREHRESRIGLNALEGCRLLRDLIYKEVKEHKRDFGEFIRIKDFERGIR